MKTKTLVLALAALLGAAGCSDLNEVPITGVTGQYFSTADGANAAVTAAYAQLRNIYGRQQETALGLVGTDSWEKGGEAGGEAPFNDYTAVLAPNMSVATNRDNWQATYVGVNAANTAIAAVEGAPLPAAEKTVRAGEGRFLRALFYHHLVRTYGDVHLTLEPSEGAILTASRTPAAEIYGTAIVPDLEFAIANLPATQSQYGRATRGAAQMLLAEVLLTRGATGDFARAASLAGEVIGSGTYALNADFRSLFCGPDRTGPAGVVISACDFVPANETNREFIYSVQFSGDGVNDQFGNWLHLMYTMAYDIAGAPSLPRTLEYGRPYRRLRPTLHLLRLWNRTTDSRYDATFQTLWASATGTRDTAIFMPGTPTVAAQYQGRRYVAVGENGYTPILFPVLRKWLDQTRTDVQSIVGGRDRHLFRLADAYLMRAEANIRAGNPAAAVADLNVLRRRAARAGQNNEMGAAELAQFNADPLNFLLDERERELCGEELRWFTLTRLSNVGGRNYFLSRVQAFNAAAAPNVKAHHALRPIPQEQIDRTEGGATAFPQNAGYSPWRAAVPESATDAAGPGGVSLAPPPDAPPPDAPPPSRAPYRDAARSPAARAADLLARMTVEEKAAQMVGVWQEKTGTLVDAAGRFDPEAARRAYGTSGHGRGLGQVGRPNDAGGSGAGGGGVEPHLGRPPRLHAELTNAVQRFFVEESRLGIPVVFHEECLHGLAAIGATSFPQPIGLAATFDPGLVERLYGMTALEARSRGTHQALTPVVDVARDPRWGRVEETFGEDPHLVARLGVAAVRGFQGDGSFRTPGGAVDKTRVLATLKHFVAHGQPEGGQNCAPVNVSPRELREVFLPPFRAAVVEAGAASVMASYNEVDGVPSHANRWLLRDVLRGEWGFRGFVVSDYYAVWELHDRPDTHGHHVAADKREACALAVRAGVNIELPEPDCYHHLADLVRDGTLSEADLDDLVGPMLEWKFRLGLFEDPYVDPDAAERLAGCDAHRELALQAARETITLLKNDGGLLPLDPARVGTVAVVGPNAHRSLLGGYSGIPRHEVTVLDGVRARLGDPARVRHAEGCRITVGGAWHDDAVVPGDPAEDRRLIAEAVAVAGTCDAIVVCVGGNEQTDREAWSRRHMGDRARLDLVGRQQELVDVLLATGKPVVVLLFGGRPLAVTELAERAPALLQCWYLGQEAGRAVAEVLFGDHTPGGKLPISVPRSAGHLPAFYNHKPSARRGYLWDDAGPLFAFGYGLSYTTFRVANVRVEHPRIPRDGRTRVLADVTNTGPRAGAETVQLYVRDRTSSVTRPVKELKGFAKVSLAPGETATAELPVGPEALAFYDIQMRYTVEPGEFSLMVGTSSRDEDLTTVTLEVTP